MGVSGVRWGQFFDADRVLGKCASESISHEECRPFEDVIANGSFVCSESGGQSIRSRWR